jgi:hypothetical protein
MDEKPAKLEFTDEEFRQVKSTAEAFYKSIGSIRCPYFNETINFNTDGLEHLKFKGWNRARKRSDQFMRLKLIKLAPEIIRNSKTLQGIWETKSPVRRKRHGAWESVFTDVTYYEFIAVLERKRIKVIVKQFLGGEKFFWTMIPYWRTNKFNKRILHDGNPEMD